MPNRSWSGHLAALILLTAAIWLSLWGLFEFRLSKLKADRAYQDYQSHTQTEQQEAAQQIAEECAVPPTLINAVRECLAEQIHSHQQKVITNQDLKAQQDMAFWAKWMVYLGAAGIPLSVLGLAALLASLAQTRRAISNDREIGEAQVRAYLRIVSLGVQHDRSIDDLLKLQIGVKNSGQSPAVHIEGVITGNSGKSDNRKKFDISFVAQDIDGGASLVNTVYRSKESLAGSSQFHFEIIIFARDVFKKEIVTWNHFTGPLALPDDGSICDIPPNPLQLGQVYINHRVEEARSKTISAVAGRERIWGE